MGDSLPFFLPTAVRAAPTITASLIDDFLPECTSIVPDGTSRAYPALQRFMLRAVDPARSCLEEAEVQDVRKHLERQRDDIVARLRDFQGGAPRVRRLHRAQATAGVSRGRDVRFLPGTH